MDQHKLATLSGLVDRQTFDGRLQNAIQIAGAQNQQHALLLLELNQHGLIHSKHGAAASAALVRQVSDLLLQNVRKQDTLACLNGAEFGLLMEQCTLNQARAIAEKLHNAVTAHLFTWASSAVKLGVSIGIAPITADSNDSVSEVLEAATSACREAKTSGANNIRIYRDNAANHTELAGHYQNTQWLHSVHEALEADRLALDYQTITRVAAPPNGEYFELLLRLQDEHGNEVLPSTFLPAVERYNLAAQLDRWVVAITLEWLNRDASQFQRTDMCAINLSAPALEDAGFLTFLRRRFDSSPALARKICFEIKEDLALAKRAEVTRFMRVLREKGCHFALADFGRGWSSFTYLKTLPVSVLKIDGGLIGNIVDDPVDRAIVKSICEVGHAMGKRVVATRVEAEDVFAKLAELGIDYAQGHYLSYPQPLTDLRFTD